MCNAAQHKGWSKQHKDKSRASSSRLTRLSFLADMILTMWHDWRDIGCQFGHEPYITYTKMALAGLLKQQRRRRNYANGRNVITSTTQT